MLLIGERGVGKSTWINAFANYCSLDSLEKAAQAGGLFSIPCNFTITDPLTNEKVAISSEAEHMAPMQITKAGESVTQNANEIVFQHGNTAINLIDTPGFLDTADAKNFSHKTDEQHVDNIFKLLSQYEEIRAIFILMKANVTRLSDAFQSTLTEIFKRLDASACNNVIFIFTYAASTKFTTDDTKPILQRFLEDKNLPIALPPHKPTIYCFENDVVKYLAECKNNVSRDKKEVEDAQNRWRRSVTTNERLLDYILSLKPFSLAVMMSINDATSTLSEVSEVVLETMMCIAKNVKKLEGKKKDAQKLQEDIKRDHSNFASKKLKSLLHITETKLVQEPLGHRNLVCEASCCAKAEGGHIVYPQECHINCDANFLYTCIRINFWANCKVCGCDKNLHRFREFRMKLVSESVYRPDSNIIDRIVDSNDALKYINNEIAQFEKRIKEYEAETQQMVEICAKLNSFAYQHALLKRSSADGSSAHDEMLKWVKSRMQTYAKSLDSPDAKEKVDVLAKIKSQYEEKLSEVKGRRYSVEDVPKLVNQLCGLRIKGQEIKRIVEENNKKKRERVENAKQRKNIHCQ